MRPPVVAKRFVNTPTVFALHEQEFGEDGLEDVEEAKEELSEEYDKVTGNEALYKTVFSYLERNGGVSIQRSGNEGLVDGVKAVIKAVIDFFKGLFRGIYNMFNGGSEAVEDRVAKTQARFKLVLNDDPIEATFKKSVRFIAPSANDLKNGIGWWKKSNFEDVSSITVLSKVIASTSELLKDIDKYLDNPAKESTAVFRDLKDIVKLHHETSALSLGSYSALKDVFGIKVQSKLTSDGKSLIELSPNELVSVDDDVKYFITPSEVKSITMMVLLEKDHRKKIEHGITDLDRDVGVLLTRLLIKSDSIGSESVNYIRAVLNNRVKSIGRLSNRWLDRINALLDLVPPKK